MKKRKCVGHGLEKCEEFATRTMWCARHREAAKKDAAMRIARVLLDANSLRYHLVRIICRDDATEADLAIADATIHIVLAEQEAQHLQAHKDAVERGVRVGRRDRT